MADFLLEFFSEEIPARMQGRALEDLQRLFLDGLKSAGIEAPAALHGFVTPRRLGLAASGLPIALPEQVEEKRGPRVDAPEAAIQGFLKAAGVADLGQCEQRDTGKGTFWFVTVKKPGQETATLLSTIVTQIVRDFPWPKSMRWRDNNLSWVRPLHRILAIFDGKILPGAIDLGREIISFGNVTEGHRFMAPAPIAISNLTEYQTALRAAKVMIDAAERKQEILRQAETLAAKTGGRLKPDEGLLQEVTGLVEWPVALMGKIDDKFMSLPPEVLSTSMRTHQKYFSVEDKTGLKPYFIAIANMETPDGGKTILAGYERVLRARLADADFFWQQDRARRLEDYLHELTNVVFYQRLGTLAQKIARVETLAAELSPLIPGADAALAGRAARLAKADLATGMVGEFPELQGIMGRYYALQQGEPPVIADAIAQHYAPLGPSDLCPTAPNSVAVALADKIDSLTGFFAIGEKPTGSKDPFALRRAALGIIRLIIDNKLRLNLREIFMRAYWAYDAQLSDFVSHLPNGHQPKALARDLMDFLADRIKIVLRDQGIRHDLIAAVFALGEDDLTRLLNRVDALRLFLSGETGIDLLTAYRRAANIVRIESKKDGQDIDEEIIEADFAQPEEHALYDALTLAARGANEALRNDDFGTAMSALGKLREPVDAFFDKVTVNADDAKLRRNRLGLLSQIGATLRTVADFSKIEG